MQVYYLEIVTPDVDATCDAYEHIHKVAFGQPEPNLGNARVAPMAGGGMVGVRAPMHETEHPIVRPYMLVGDIAAATESAVKAGAEVAHPPMELPGFGKFAILIHGGVQHGLWEE